MLECQRCHRKFDEYYRMSDGKILCKDCWRDELNLAEMRAEQGRRDKNAFEQKRAADQVRLKQLEFAIKLEKGKCQRAWSDYEENMDDNLCDKPYNYVEVERLKRECFDLSLQLDKNKRVSFISPFFDYTAYYRTAQFISKSQSHYFETVTLPAEQETKRKAEQERICAEQKRIKAEQERQKKETEERKKREEELKPYEEDILNKKKVPCQLRIKVAKETYREEVMLRCVRDSAISVFNALKQNPNITPKVKSLIEKKENSRIYIPPVNNYSISDVSSPVNTEVNAPKEEIGCFGWFMIVVIVMGIIWLLINS